MTEYGSASEVVEKFEQGEAPGGEFHHRDHILVAWCYLQEFPLLEALTRLVAAIQRFALAKGAPDLYHATITVGYMMILSARIAENPGLSWVDFEQANPDLFIWPNGALGDYFSTKQLADPRAKREFVLPDLVATGWGHNTPSERSEGHQRSRISEA